jgi:transcriptional regulator with XRE-family HTH domain
MESNDRELSSLIGQRIRERRRQKGLSQSALAEQVDLAQQAIYKIESGLTTPGLHRLVAIAKALDMSVGDIVEGTNGKQPRSITVQSMTGIEAELIAAFRRFSDIQSKRALLQVARRMCVQSTKELE